MWDSKLCLSLLLVTLAASSAQDDQRSCLLSQQFKPYHKYEFQYRAESLSGIDGASRFKNGPVLSCTIDIEVPQACSFIVHTRGCGLEEAVAMNMDGEPVYGPSPTSENFRAEMETYPLKFTVDGDHDVKVYPEDGESTAILNIKRGFLSALVVPLFEENKRVTVPTIHGMCKTQFSIQDTTGITLIRDLSACDKFVPMRDHTSPLALISGMNRPLAQLVRSSQTCTYNFDSEEKHMTSGTCSEHHILIPFSHKRYAGVTNVGQQKITLLQASPYNNRVFEHSGIVKGLSMEAVEDKSALQDKEAGLSLLRELASLPESEGEKRAHLFHKLVTVVRGMKVEALSLAVPEAMEVSSVLSYQVLAQCGTPECSSAIMQILRTMDSSSIEVDAAVFALGLVSNPSPLLIHDLLQMAKYKASKPILYALSNAVKRFYKAEESLIPEIHSVAEFMASQLGDCSGDQEKSFLLLRVIGNMAPAMSPAGPALRSAVMQCVNQPAASLSVQKAAIQVFRLTPVPDEGRETLMQVLLDGTNPLQKRIAAYLVLMKNPQQSELSQLTEALSNEQEKQVKSFIISHITNILSTTQPETEELRKNIREALQGNEVGPTMDPIKFSRNYRLGSVEGNMIFEDTSYLPKEVMLEMVLKAFGLDIDMMEFGMEGKGFEPTAEALFGLNGFFPDTTLKTMYFVSENMPQPLSEVLQTIVPILKRDEMKKQASKEFMRELGHNVNKLMTELKAAQTPEAMVYMKLLGNELGYLKTSDIEEMAYSAVMMMDSMMKLFPGDLMKALMTKTDNAVYAHYIFMDNEFFLPTGSGVPLRFSLSGTFTPGMKGGLKIAPDMSEVAFMPSAGIEFITRVGSFIPEYVSSGLEMHTNLFHESGLSAKISMERGSVKLTIPPPTTPMKLLKMTNNLVAVSGSDVMTIPPMVKDKVDVNDCTSFFAGMKYCYALQYTDTLFKESAPFFPLTGDSKLAVELHPVVDVTEYTATIAYELLMEGDDDKQKVDTVKVVLRAESADPTEASVTLKYNRRRHFLSADMEMPDMDFEAGLRLGVGDDITKGQGTHSISLDFVKKNIPQASLIGRAKMAGNKDAMLQVQLLVPALSTDATVTANMKHEDALELELKSEIKIMDTTSVQEISMNYDTEKIAVAFKSDVNAETSMLPNADVFEKYGNQLLDTQVADMKVREMFRTFGETANIYMEKYAAEVPFIHDLRVPDMPVISLPERLFMNTETKLVYYVNDERFTIAIPLPLGGKSIEELKFPPVLTTPSLSLPQFGLEIVSVEIPIPDLVVPESLTLSIPLFGKAEASTLLKSNLYDAQATFTAGKDDVQPPSYSVKFDVKGTSPIDVLSVKVEGSGMLAVHDSLEAQLNTSVVHHLFKASVSITEDVTISDKVIMRSNSKINALSPLGLDITLDHSGMIGFNTDEVSADSTFDGMFKAGPMNSKTTSTQSFVIFPFRPEAKLDSTTNIDSTVMNAQNRIAASLDNGEFSFVSTTNAFENLLTHAGELIVKENRLSLKSDANVIVFGINFHNLAETSAGVSEVTFRMETNTDHSENPVYSLVTATLDVEGLAISSDAAVKLLENEAVHKATLTMNKEHLTISGSTTLQSPLSLENTFNFALDTSKASLAINNKAQMSKIKIDNPNTLVITLSSIDFTSKADASVSDVASYTHDITVNIKPDTAAANVNNVLKLWAAEITNEAQLQAELYKVDLTGSLKAIYGDEEIKHIYQVNFVDSANAKCSTTGKILGTHMNQNTELEVVGLAARLTHDARFNSQPMRFDYNIRSSVVPFDFNLDAVVNADGDMTLYGKHSAQLYDKFLLRAQPLALASSHECRASVSQQLNSGFSIETTVDNKMETVLSLTEQKASLRLKSKMNENTFNHELSLYNTPDRAGVEVSGTILTNILNVESTDNQEYSIASFLKYDKSTNGHLIQIPLLTNLPTLLENVRGFVIYMAETLQVYINNEKIKANLEALPQYVSDFVSQLNVDDKAAQLKQFLGYLRILGQEYAITMENVEDFLNNLWFTVEDLLADFTSTIQHYVGLVKETLISDTFPETVIQNIQQHLHAFNEEYDIKAFVDYVINTLREMVQQMDFEKLRGSSVAFLLDLDAQYEIKAKLQMLVSYIKQMIETFDLQQFITDLKRGVQSINLRAHFETLLNQLPTDKLSDVRNYIRKMVEDLKIIDKINSFNAKIREFIVRFDIDKKIAAVLEKALELIKNFKIEETIQTVVMMVKDADTKITQIFNNAVNHLKSTEMTDVIPQLNAYLFDIQEKLRSFDYNEFVEYLNMIIAKYTANVNEMINSLEIPQKFEAARDFSNFILSSLRGSVERMREMQSSEVLKALQDMADELLFNNLKALAEAAKQSITNLDISAEITSYLQMANKYYTDLLIFASDLITDMGELLNKMTSEQKIIGELMQIAEVLITELKKAHLNMPSFTIPFTDLVVPSKTLILGELEIPAQLTIPEFTVLGFYTVEETTISTDDVKERLIALIDYILNFEFDVAALIRDINLNYLPSIPEFSIPPIKLPEFSFPNLPIVSAEKLVETLKAPTIVFPVIPTDLTIPSFGKMSHELSMKTPVFSLRNAAEVQTSGDMTTPKLTCSLLSHGTSSQFEILNFNLETTGLVVALESHSLKAVETLKFTHDVLTVDHQATVTVSDFLPEASIKTTLKATTAPYNAELVNEVHVVTTEGLSATTDTSYRHVLSLPMIDFTSETSVMQKCVVQKEGQSITLTIGNQGTTAFNSYDNTHKSDLQVIISPGMFRVSVNSDTDTFLLKMKQTMNSDFDLFSYFKMDFRSEVEGSEIKNSVMLGSVNANLHDMQLDLKATHNADLTGFVSGTVDNMIEVVIRTTEVVFVFENKGSGKLSFSDALSANIDLQNDYSASFRHDEQRMNTLALARLNQHKLLWNLTAENNNWEFVVLAAAKGVADFAFLSQPLNIPAITIPFVNSHTPAISNLDLYELTGLKNILTTTEQTVDFNSKTVFRKSQAGPFLNVPGPNYVPSLYSLTTELSFKSDIFNLSMDTALYGDDLVLRLAAITVSEFEALKVKLNLSVGTTLQMVPPILGLEADQDLVASSMNIKANFDIPMINAAGKAEADHSLKVKGTSEDVSVELANKANMDGTLLENYLHLGLIDDMNIHLSKDGLRSAYKVIADTKVIAGTDKLIGLDLNGNLAAEASLTKVYAVLKYAGNNEANLFGLTTIGKHIAQATVDIAPFSSMAADVEIDFAQQSNLGDLSIFEKVVAEVSGATQKISANGKFISPMYSTNMAAEVEGNAPVLKVTLKSSATCPITVFLDYDLDSSITTTFDDAGLTLTGKGVFTHADVIVDLQNSLAYTQSDAHITVNMDINSFGFTDVNLRCAVRKDGTSATISIPSTGLLALQFQSRVPSQMNARLYGRHASDPGSDIEIFTIRVSAKEADKLKLKMFFNLDSPDTLLRELQERRPIITSCLSDFAEKYGLSARAAQLKNNIIYFTEEAHDIAYSRAPDMSEVSRLFRNTVAQYQKTLQNLLNAAIRFLNETRVKLPGSDRESTVIEVVNSFTFRVSTILEMAMDLLVETVEKAYDVFDGVVSNIQVTLPDGEVLSASRILHQVKDTDFDLLLEKLGYSLGSVTAKAQDFVDNILKSDVAESVAVYVNIFYDKYVALIKTITMYANTVDMQSINNAIDYILEVFKTALNKCRVTATDYLQDVPAQYKTYVRVKGTRLEFNL